MAFSGSAAELGAAHETSTSSEDCKRNTSLRTPSMEFRDQMRDIRKRNSGALDESRADLFAARGDGPFYGVMRRQAVTGVYPTLHATQEAGDAAFSECEYTVHEVAKRPRRIGAAAFNAHQT